MLFGFLAGLCCRYAMTSRHPQCIGAWGACAAQLGADGCEVRPLEDSAGLCRDRWIEGGYDFDELFSSNGHKMPEVCQKW